MRKKLLVGVFIGLSITVLSAFGAAYAQSNSQSQAEPSYTQRLQQIASDTQEQQTTLEEEGARSCQLTANQLHGLHRQSELTLNYRVDTYQVILSDLNQLAITRESQDASVSELRASIAELSDRVTDFTTSYAQYRAELLEAANIACNEQTELRATISRALSALRTSQFHAERVAEYAQGELNNLLQDLEQGNE